MNLRNQKEEQGFLAHLMAVVLCAVAILMASAPASSRSQTAEGQTCVACHEEISHAFPLTPHGAVGANCASCHGSPEKHLKEGGKGTIFAFVPNDQPTEKSGRCLVCHAQDNPRYFASPHAKASLDCTSCHSLHQPKLSSNLLSTSTEKSCSLCHQDISAEFQLNERHRLQEGILACTTCHDPHEPSSRGRLGGFANELCLRCHTDKGGPYIYEHRASRVEGCTVCHEVHGSPNRHMLKFQNSADLCFSCHAAAPAWHSRFTSDATNCVSCHTAIHGSNLSPLFLK